VAGGARKNANTVLIAALAGGATVEAAAKQARVSETTVYRRLREADFAAQVKDARQQFVAEAVGQLARAGTDAAATLHQLLDAEAETVRLGAAKAILDLGTRLRESEELAQRVEALELAQQAAAANSQKGRRRWGN
jgi:hypothetical protein